MPIQHIFTEEEILLSQNRWKNHGKFMGRQDSSFWLTKEKNPTRIKSA